MYHIVGYVLTSVCTMIASYAYVSYKLKQINEVPPGTIIMWNGPVETIPKGWVLCDGDNGTPDTLGRYVYGHIKPGLKFNKRFEAETENDGAHSHKMSKSGGGYADALHKLADNRDRTIVYVEVESADGHKHKIKKVDKLNPDSVTSIFIMKS